MVCYIEVCQRSGSRHCGLLYRSFVKGVVLVIVVCYIYEFCQRSGSRYCGLLYRSFVKGVVLVIVVCYIGVLSKE